MENDAITINVKLDTSEIERSADDVARKLRTALNGPNGPMGRGLRDSEAAALRLAQAHARLAVASGNVNQAQTILATAIANTTKQTAAQINAQIQLINVQNRLSQQSGGLEQFFRRYSSKIREAGESIQQAGAAFTRFITGPLLGLGRAAVQSAVDIDRQVNVLKALTGSAEAAERRLASLIATAQKTPGLTTSLAATLDAQLRVLRVSEQTIDRLLPAIGRLNAIAPLGDPQKFAQNLIQLVTQNFDKQDLRELVGQSPVAGQLIQQIFNVDSPTNAKAIRAAAQRMGITSVEAFFAAFSQAAANNPALQSVTESLGAQFEKLRDRIIVALRPLGLALIQTLQPLVEKLVPVVERISNAFAQLPEPARQALIVFGALAAAIGPALVIMGGFIQSLGALADLAVVVAGAGGLGAIATALGPLLAVVAAVAAEVVILGAAFSTNFGGIRTVVGDVINFASSQFAFVKKAIADNGVEIEKLKLLFSDLSREAAPIIRALGTLAKNEFALVIKGAIIAAEVALKAFNVALETTISLFRTVKSGADQVGKALESLGNILMPGLDLGTRTRNALSAPFQDVIVGNNPPSSPLSTGDALRLLTEDMNKLFALDPRLNRTGAGSGGSGAGGSGAARQQTELQREIENVATLTKQLEALRKGEGKLFEELMALEAQRDRAKELKATVEKETFILSRFRRGLPLPVELPGLADLSGVRPNITAAAPPVAGFPGLSTTDDTAEVSALRAREFEQRLRIQEVRIQNDLNAGLLSGAEAQRAMNDARRAARDEIIAVLEVQRQTVGANSLEGLQLTEQIEQMRMLGVELSNTQRFMRGFGSEIETVGDAFERLGKNVSRALLDTRDLLNSLKQSVVQFFNDLLGQSLQNLMRQIFAPIAGILGGGATGGIGSIFRTPSTFPASVSSTAFSLAGAFAGAGGGGLAAPPSISAAQQFQEFIGLATATRPRTVTGGAGGVVNSATRSGFSLSGLLGSLGAAAPFIGLSLGSNLGGPSTLGNIFGAGAGAALGFGISMALPILAEGGLAALGPAALAFAGPAALIAAPLLIGSILLGKASQRRKDEEASGQMLTQALQSIEQLATAISTDQIDGSQARALFDNQILATFRQQIGTLQTKSVRDSRLTNQVRDLQNVYEARIPPLIEAQNERRRIAQRNAAIDARLIPQFAVGGFVPGVNRGYDSVLALLTPGELVLNRAQQMAVMRDSRPDVFERAGVPSAGQPIGPAQAFDGGGYAQASDFRQSDEPLVINLTAEVVLGDGTAEGLFVRGGMTSSGRRVIVHQVDEQLARKNGRW